MLRPREIGGSRAPLAMFPALTPTLAPATHTNSYALGGREVLLVEPATPYEAEQRAWVEWARGLASSGREPIAILATHHHLDHVGGAELLARELDRPIWAHPLTVERLPEAARARVGRRLDEGDAIVLDGPRPQRWRVLFTPGHAPGHVCLWDEDERVVVVGDMVASVGTILIAPGDGDMTRYLV
jgi:glyoxylase-like metal-dependent hydrolase (beta-lactamase superfamily II)